MKLSKKSLRRIRAILLEVTPEITAILDEVKNIGAVRSASGGALSEAEAATRGVEIVKELVDVLLVRQYDRIVRILAALHEVEPEELEDKPLEDVVDMVADTLSDDMLLRFFPQLRLLRRETPSAI